MHSLHRSGLSLVLSLLLSIMLIFNTFWYNHRKNEMQNGIIPFQHGRAGRKKGGRQRGVMFLAGKWQMSRSEMVFRPIDSPAARRISDLQMHPSGRWHCWLFTDGWLGVRRSLPSLLRPVLLCVNTRLSSAPMSAQYASVAKWASIMGARSGKSGDSEALYLSWDCGIKRQSRWMSWGIRVFCSLVTERCLFEKTLLLIRH